MAKKYSKIPIFTKNQRRGILALALLVITCQLLYFIYLKYKSTPQITLTTADLNWLNQQKLLDSIQKADSSKTQTIHPFNPNFISDFKGYQLGMSVAQIDRLHAFRKKNKYVNSAQEFQHVTQISDSLLHQLQPYFNFPKKPQKIIFKSQKDTLASHSSKKQAAHVSIDLNLATVSELQKVSGIGDVLSQRIIDVRNKYQAFVAWEQLDLVFGLQPEVVRRMQKIFTISAHPAIKKIAINDASIQEIIKIPYISYALAKQIVIYRSKNGDFSSINDLEQVTNFPSEKSKIINEYLQFN